MTREDKQAVAEGKLKPEEAKYVYFSRCYPVFNAEEFEGLDEKYYARETPGPLCERLDNADRFFRSLPGEPQYSGNRAFYDVGEDIIRIPHFEAFDTPQSFYAALAHEYIHYTGAPGRLDRFGRYGPSGAAHAAEELVAEIGLVLLCLDPRIAPNIPQNNVAYVAAWLKDMKKDPPWIFKVMSQAGRAVDWLKQRAEEAKPPRSVGVRRG